MASNKQKGQNIDDLLSGDIPQGIIKRGAGLHTSLDTSEHAPVDEHLSHHRTSAKTPTPPARIARGYKFREDLIKQCKQIALDEDKKLYEVMEEALEEYIARKQVKR